ncbi:unnamed protein product [Prorocentrum cordatum]|uniref:Anaphase-promoting complex subunit 5 n=1 Tax=Prorocentrum cordatum TaxID=2364126 RepID=A0ABN9VFY5_9DINO|nr:unnamed protein product [Polarella glacialis]
MLCVPQGSRPGDSSLDVGIAECQRTKQWSSALQLLRHASQLGERVGPHHYLASVSTCGKCSQWQQALLLLSAMWQATWKLGVVAYSAGISACGKGSQWQQALSLLSELRGAELQPDSATTRSSARAREASSGSTLCYCSARWGPRDRNPT